MDRSAIEPRSGGTDYGRTHFCDEASGLTAGPVYQLLEAAAFAGDRAMVDEGLRLLRILHQRFARRCAPRRPDLGDPPAHAGHPRLGLPGQGLRPGLRADRRAGTARGGQVLGVDGRAVRLPGQSDRGQGRRALVGPFATTPVLGATNWIAPNWIGLPVQWCGLVYADGLTQLARLDPRGPWRSLAQGIAASGILQTYPIDHPHHGLLPDSFNLLAQSRNPADINPGTLQPLALLLAGDHPAATPYQFRALRSSGLWVHAPGAVDVDRRRGRLGRD